MMDDGQEWDWDDITEHENSGYINGRLQASSFTASVVHIVRFTLTKAGVMHRSTKCHVKATPLISAETSQ